MLTSFIIDIFQDNLVLNKLKMNNLSNSFVTYFNFKYTPFVNFPLK